ncbi:MAG: ArnT family glycosyltransferase [Candidatus Helarchaeota archaeon]
MNKSLEINKRDSPQGTNFFKKLFNGFSDSIKIKSNQYSIYVLIFFVINSIFLLFTSHVNIDENFYTYCTKLFWDGFVPYVDYFFTQSPGLLYFYGLPLSIFGNNLLNSRIITFCLTFMTAILIIKLSKNLNYEWAGIYTVLALSISWWFLFNLIITKTYALTVFFIVLSLYVLSMEMNDFWKNVLSIVFMGLAGGIRLNMTVLSIFLACWIAVKEWDKSSKIDLLKNLIKYVLIAAIVLLLIYGPIFLIDLMKNHSLAKSFYNILGVHSNRNLTLNVSVGIFGNLSLILDAILMYITISALFIFLPIFFYFTIIRKRGFKAILKKYELIFLIFAVQLLIYGVYIMLATLFYEYIITAIPLTLMLIFMGLSKFFNYMQLHHPNIAIFQRKYQKYIVIGIIISIPLTQLAQINQFVIPRAGRPLTERIIYNDLNSYQDITSIISILSPPWGYIMTYDCALATQSGRNLLPGYEMSYFSYHHWFEPFGLLTPICIYYHVINGEIVYHQLQSNYTTMAVFTLGEAFFTFLNERFDNNLFYGNNITEVLNTNYNLIAIYPGFGQVNDVLFIYQRKNIDHWITLPGLPINPFDF